MTIIQDGHVYLDVVRADGHHDLVPYDEEPEEEQ